ncbi:MAG: hypothetical protein WC076_00755 [Terrimicrobiaceae bacterium]|nr:hypothetical protein [Terrimicrobiaceae bacterium]
MAEDREDVGCIDDERIFGDGEYGRDRIHRKEEIARFDAEKGGEKRVAARRPDSRAKNFRPW